MSKTYWSQRIEELANSEKAVPDTVFFTSEAYRSYTETAAKDMITGVCGCIQKLLLCGAARTITPPAKFLPVRPDAPFLCAPIANKSL